MSFEYDPPTGLLDTSVYPDVPASPTAARQQFMDLFYQARDQIGILSGFKIFAAMPPYNVSPNGSDQTANIQAAINAANTNGGGTVLLPKGTYITLSSLIMKTKVYIEGVEPGNVFFDKVNPVGSIIQYNGTDWAIKFPDDVNASQSGLKNVTILGNDSAKGGINICPNGTSGLDPSLDLIFDGVASAYFRNGYGIKMGNTWRNAFYSCVFRQCGVGIATTDTTNDITFTDTTVEWCSLGVSLVNSTAIYFFGLLAEGLGQRANQSLPSDLFVWSSYTNQGGARTLSYYNGGVRNYNSLVTILGGYMEEISGDFFMLENGSKTTITGFELEVLAGSPSNYVVNKTNGAYALIFKGNRVWNSPSVGVVNLDSSAFNCDIQANSWEGSKSAPFFINVGSTVDGGTIQSPDQPSQLETNFGTHVFAPDVSTSASFKLLGSYTRGVLDNYWEFYRLNGDGTDKLLNIRRKNGGAFESYLTFNPDSMYFSKPIIIDSGQFMRLGHTASSFPAEGDTYYDTTAHALKVYTNTGWKTATLT